MFHGFIKPSTIMVTQNNRPNRIFALMDMRLITGMDNSLEQMKIFPGEVFSPLSPRQMNSYKTGSSFFYESKDDIWALGICTLCFIFFEDFNVYYDWNKKAINMNKIQTHLEALRGK